MIAALELYAAGAAVWITAIAGMSLTIRGRTERDHLEAIGGAAVLAPVWPLGVWLVARTMITPTRAQRR